MGTTYFGFELGKKTVRQAVFLENGGSCQENQRCTYLLKIQKFAIFCIFYGQPQRQSPGPPDGHGSFGLHARNQHRINLASDWLEVPVLFEQSPPDMNT